MLTDPYQIPNSLPDGVTQLKSRPALPSGTVAYLFDVTQQRIPDDVTWQILDNAERERASRFKRPVLHRQFTQCHALLKLILAHHAQLPVSDIELRTGKQGKPALSGAAAATGIEFNLTHSGSLAAVAISDDVAVGIDIEQIRASRDLERIATHFFAPAECQDILALPQDKQLHAFFRCWCRKESFIKALGLGLSMPLDKFAVSVGPDEPAALVSVDYAEEQISNWQMFSLVVPSGYCGALTLAVGNERS